jgi:hypothetical protein
MYRLMLSFFDGAAELRRPSLPRDRRDRVSPSIDIAALRAICGFCGAGKIWGSRYRGIFG